MRRWRSPDWPGSQPWQEVLNASHDVSIAGKKPVDAVVRRVLDELAEAVQKLNAEFPEALRSPV